MAQRLTRAAPSGLIAGIIAAVAYATMSLIFNRGSGATQAVIVGVVIGVITFVLVCIIAASIATLVSRSRA